MKKYLLLVFLCGFWISRAQSAYTQTTASTEVPLVTLLNELSDKHDIRFSYNVRLIRGLRITRPMADLSLTGSLAYISDLIPIRFDLANEGNYAIIPIRSRLNFQVSDAADDTPIALVYVTINGTKQRYLIPNNGTYFLDNSFPSDSLEITTSFYTPVRTTAADITRQNGRVLLSQDTVNLGEVTILSYLTSGVNSFLGDHHVEINMKDLGLIAGETDGDILQVLQAIPGIRSPNGKPGSLNFRGSPFGLNLTLFDDIPIYHNGHFFGTFSPYNPGVVRNIEVYRGNLPSKWGGRVGGLINVKTSNEVPEKVKTGVIANTVIGGLEFEAPITRRLGLILSARANYPIDRFSPKLDAYADFNFQGSAISSRQVDGNNTFFDQLKIRFSDISGKLIYDVSNQHKLTFSYLNIQNSLVYDLNSQGGNRNQREDNILDNTGFTFNWTSKWSDQVSTRLAFTNSSYNIFEDRVDLDRGNRKDNSVENIIKDNRFKALVEWQANENATWNFGYNYADQKATFEESENGNIGVLEKKNNEAETHSLFANLEQELGARLILNAGLRTDFYSVNQNSFIDPRLSLTYLVSKSFFVKGAASRAHQYISQQFGNDFADFKVGTQFWTLAERDDQIVEGLQFMAGALYDKGDWLLDLELYANDIENISRPGIIDDQDPEPDQRGDLQTLGADLLIKKRWKRFETWFSYTLGQTEDSFRRTTQFSYYDQRHALNIKWLYSRKKWNFALSWGMMTGLPVYLPSRDQILDGNSLDVPYEDRFPVQHQMDLSTTYRFSPAGAAWKGIIGFSVLNLYDRENIINIFQSNVRSNDFLRQGIRFAPNLQVKIIF